MKNLDWLSLKWFSFSTIEEFNYGFPVFKYIALATLVFIPLTLIIRHFVYSKTYTTLLKQSTNGPQKLNPILLLKVIPTIFLTLSIALLCFSASSPQKSDDNNETWTDGIDIMLTLDISGSMEYMDFKPNRLEKLKQVTRGFIDGRKNDKIGLIVFAGEAYSKAPLTLDYGILKEHVKSLSTKEIQEEGTAIGNALALSVQRMQNSPSKSKIMILVSDGENNQGNVSPSAAAEIAKENNIKTYTIGIGKDGKVLAGYVNSFFGKVPQYIDNTFDEKTLKSIANKTGGKYFRAKNEQALNSIFQTINELEKTEFKESHYKTFKNYFHIYLIWGFIFLLLWLLCKLSFINNLSID